MSKSTVNIFIAGYFLDRWLRLQTATVDGNVFKCSLQKIINADT